MILDEFACIDVYATDTLQIQLAPANDSGIMLSPQPCGQGCPCNMCAGALDIAAHVRGSPLKRLYSVGTTFKKYLKMPVLSDINRLEPVHGSKM